MYSMIDGTSVVPIVSIWGTGDPRCPCGFDYPRLMNCVKNLVIGYPRILVFLIKVKMGPENPKL